MKAPAMGNNDAASQRARGAGNLDQARIKTLLIGRQGNTRRKLFRTLSPTGAWTAASAALVRWRRICHALIWWSRSPLGCA